LAGDLEAGRTALRGRSLTDVVKRPFKQEASASPDLVQVDVFGDTVTKDLYFKMRVPFNFGFKQAVKNLPTESLYLLQEIIEGELAKRPDAKR
jgi:hypothetical protein